MTEIRTIELHYSNRCSGCCKICAKTFSPNRFKPAFATINYTLRMIECLKEIECRELQTGGDGDSFLNPIYLDSLKMIKDHYPGQKIALYTSAFSLTPERTDRILREKLIDEINVRLDTTQPDLYSWHTGMNLSQTLSNLEYFRRHNDRIDLTIIYFPLHLYAPTCRSILGKEPAFFHEAEVLDLLRDEEQEVYSMISQIPGPMPIRTRRSGICLWAERYDAEPDTSTPCRHLDDAFDWQGLVYPNGDVGTCAYDSSQDQLVYGNIFRDSLAALWTGDRKKQIVDEIRLGKRYGKFPCNSPKACGFYDV